MPRALVIGDIGIVGRNMLRHLDAAPGWTRIGVSRRPVAADSDHLAVDLTDRDAALAVAERLRDVTHLFVCARVPAPTATDEAAANRRLLENALDTLERAAAPLERVVLVHGTKWYGSHLGPYRVPAKESDPRHMPPNFYHDQQDVAEQRASRAGWSWTALRPHTVWGFSRGTGNNIVVQLAVYAALSRALGLPLRFPGSPACWTKFSQATHVDLLNRAMLWAATAPAAANEAFNVTNGDVFRWSDVWPAVADAFAMSPGPVQTISLTTMMADKSPVWDAIVARHQLETNALGDLVRWDYGDGLLGWGWDDISSTTKIRQAGFAEAIDSEECLIRCLTELRQDRIVP